MTSADSYCPLPAFRMVPASRNECGEHEDLKGLELCMACELTTTTLLDVSDALNALIYETSDVTASYRSAVRLEVALVRIQLTLEEIAQLRRASLRKRREEEMSTSAIARETQPSDHKSRTLEALHSG
jgi:hypothetical protein